MWNKDAPVNQSWIWSLFWRIQLIFSFLHLIVFSIKNFNNLSNKNESQEQNKSK